MSFLTERSEWLQLKAHFQNIEPLSLNQLFAADPQRSTQFLLKHSGLTLDYSKNRLNQTTLNLLIALAHACQFQTHREGLFRGQPLNTPEHSVALHTALRDEGQEPLYYQGQNIVPQIQATLTRMETVSREIREKQWKGASGAPITDVVNLGIGGSHLGPQLACLALQETVSPVKMHFISNIDPFQIEALLARLDPKSTLFIVASKSFTTTETLLNMRIAIEWLKKEAIQKQMIAITAHPARALEYGISAQNVFEIGHWVGGRYSIWSAMGLSLAIAIGFPRFKEFLQGAHALDRHFQTAPLHQNMPVILALIGIWYINFFNARTQAIIPYTERLSELPRYLQQLEMESNGKSVTKTGRSVDYATSPVLWGSVGTDSQHAFHQLLHQGTHLIPIDFLLIQDHKTRYETEAQFLNQNCVSQMHALMTGDPGIDVDHALPGNKPSTLIALDLLTPFTLGALISLYEHKVFVQSVIWDLNPFDQPGVEYGKSLARHAVASKKEILMH